MKYIIGIDEVGRGPVAGPVAVCAFFTKSEKLENILLGIDLPIRDSKKLSKKHRESWFVYLKKEKEKGNCDFAVSLVNADQIDKSGIVKCIQKALDYSLNKVVSQAYKNFSVLPSLKGLKKVENFQNPSSFSIYLDGGLKADKQYTNQETIIKGDETHAVISFASIIAKVSRDRLMEKYALDFPGYGFEKNSGYGTKAHYDALKKYGTTVLHRKTFLKNLIQDKKL